MTHRFSDLVANSEFWAWETDNALRIVFLSDNFETLTGFPKEAVLGFTQGELCERPPDDPTVAEHAETFAARQPFRGFRCPTTIGKGGLRWIESSGQPCYDDNGRFLGYCGLSRDVTADMQVSAQLEKAGRDMRISETVFHHVERIAKIGAWTLDLRSKNVTWTDEVYRIYGLPPGSVVTVDEAIGSFGEDSLRDLQVAMDWTIETGEPFDLTLNLHPDAQTMRWVRVIGEAERVKGETVTLFGTIQDVTAERTRQDEFRKLAETDHLTGLSNRAAFQAEARSAIEDSARDKCYGAVCLVDLDRFKQTNDHFGHAAGDAVLKQTSAWLTSVAEEDSSVARLGGDEFAVLLTGFRTLADLDAAVEDRFSRLLHKVDFQGRTLEICASVGYAIFPKDGNTFEEVIACADLALYDSKSRGRRKIGKYRPRLGTEFARKMDLINAFKEALAGGHVVPHYQPIVELETGRVSGFEALARWDHPDKGVLAAGQFSDVFDDPELVVEIGKVVLDGVMRDLEGWNGKGVPFGRVGINFTDVNLLEPGFPLDLSARVGRASVRPQQLIVEVTENTVFKSQTLIVDVLEQIRSLGVLVALDDFGTGYSSLTHLQDIPFDILKIDKSFTRGIGSSAASRAIIRSVVGLGKALGYTTVAEGIETQADIDGLKALECERGQGFYFARPMPGDAVPGFLAGRKVSERSAKHKAS